MKKVMLVVAALMLVMLMSGCEFILSLLDTDPALAINPSSVNAGSIGTTYTFTLNATGIPSGASSVVFEWNFGDGSTGNATVSVSFGKASKTISHSYSANSAYGLVASVKNGSTVLATAFASVVIGTPVVRPGIDLTALDAWTAANSGGTGITVDEWSIGTLPTGCVFDIRWDTYGIPDKFIVEYPIGTTVYQSGWRGGSSYDGDPAYPGGVVGDPVGEALAIFTKTASQNKFKVIIIGGESGTSWKYSMKARMP